MTIGALDYGRKRIGFAVADAAGIAAHPVAVIERRSLERDLEAIRDRLKEFEVTEVVVGMPLNMDGSAGRQAHLVETFAAQLGAATGLPIHLYDERLTSFEAEDRMRATVRRKNRKQKLDAVAACVILEGWLRERQPR